MAGYPNLDEMDELWPDEGYAVIIEDEWKPLVSDDFVNVLHQSSNADFTLSSAKEGYSYWVHDVEGKLHKSRVGSIQRGKQLTN